MMRKLSWWIVVAALAVPVAAAWATEGKAGGAAGTSGAESGCCCPICCGHG